MPVAFTARPTRVEIILPALCPVRTAESAARGHRGVWTNGMAARRNSAEGCRFVKTFSRSLVKARTPCPKSIRKCHARGITNLRYAAQPPNVEEGRDPVIKIEATHPTGELVVTVARPWDGDVVVIAMSWISTPVHRANAASHVQPEIVAEE